MESIKKIVAENIKAARKKKKWTQNDLAVESGVSFRGLQDIETGKRTPRTDTINAIAGALGVAPNDLYRDADTISTAFENLTKGELDVIREITKQSVKEALAESKGLPNNFQTPQQELIDLINRLDAESINVVSNFVRAHMANQPKAPVKRASRAR